MTRLDRDLRLLALAMLLYAFGYGMYYQLLGVYALELGASRFAVGALNAVMLTFWAAGILPGAWAACRFSLRAVIVGVWWITLPAAVCFLLAPSWEWLIPGFVLSGCYMANNPAMKVYIQRKADPDRLASTMSLVFGASSVGFIFSPLLGGYLADRIGMRWVFALSAGIFLLSSLTATLTRSEPYRPEAGPPRPRELARNRSLAGTWSSSCSAFWPCTLGSRSCHRTSPKSTDRATRRSGSSPRWRRLERPSSTSGRVA